MKILAVADEPSRSLETMIETDPGRYRDIDCIVSCGDLDREYLEYLADNLRKPLFFVVGNHRSEPDTVFRSLNPFAASVNYAAGSTDLHGRMEDFGDYLMVGFSGSMWYNGNPNQYTERVMARVVRRMERKILWRRLKDRLRRRKPKDIIVLSHAPLANVHDLPDVCHQGFSCFRHFVERLKPIVWMHGHIHLADPFKNQISQVDRTSVVNVYSCKVLDITDRHMTVLSHCI